MPHTAAALLDVKPWMCGDSERFQLKESELRKSKMSLSPFACFNKDIIMWAHAWVTPACPTTTECVSVSLRALPTASTIWYAIVQTSRMLTWKPNQRRTATGSRRRQTHWPSPNASKWRLHDNQIPKKISLRKQYIPRSPQQVVSYFLRKLPCLVVGCAVFASRIPYFCLVAGSFVPFLSIGSLNILH